MIASKTDCISASILSRLLKQWSTYPLKVRPDLCAAARIALASSNEHRISNAVRFVLSPLISIDIIIAISVRLYNSCSLATEASWRLLLLSGGVSLEAKARVNSERHYHIRWSDSNVDWKPFNTSEQAREVAERIKRPNENYIIEEYDGGCERCRVAADFLKRQLTTRP